MLYGLNEQQCVNEDCAKFRRKWISYKVALRIKEDKFDTELYPERVEKIQLDNTGNRMGSRWRRSFEYNSGYEAARRHILEAESFSKEIGGNDEDVKRYFFNLKGGILNSILQEYGQLYGSAAEAYARQTLPKWAAGRTRMSGLFAKRLFSLLPTRMPLKTKYELAENVWRHFGPKSSHSYIVGPEASGPVAAEIISSKINGLANQYSIPKNIKNRFNWLSAGDVDLHEKLLNHFRQLEKSLAIQKVTLELPILQRQVRENPQVTHRAKSVIAVHKHEVAIWVDAKSGDTIAEGTPKGVYGGDIDWWRWAFIAAPAVLLISFLAR